MDGRVESETFPTEFPGKPFQSFPWVKQIPTSQNLYQLVNAARRILKEDPRTKPAFVTIDWGVAAENSNICFSLRFT